MCPGEARLIFILVHCCAWMHLYSDVIYTKSFKALVLIDFSYRANPIVMNLCCNHVIGLIFRNLIAESSVDVRTSLRTVQVE